MPNDRRNVKILNKARLVAALVLLILWVTACCGHPLLPVTRASTAMHKTFLPNGFRPEGITAAGTAEYYVSGLGGTLVHHDSKTGINTVVATEPQTPLTGVKYDPIQHMLFVAGSTSGKAIVYTLQKGSSSQVQFRMVLDLHGGYINDVAIGNSTVWFSDSQKPFVHSIPRFHVRHGGQQQKYQPHITKHYLGPSFKCAGLCANGLTEAAPGVVIVAHWLRGQLFKLDTTKASNSGSSHVTKVDLSPDWVLIDGRRPLPDGLAMEGADTLWVADNLNNRLLRVHLSADYTVGRLSCVLTSPDLNTPSTGAVHEGMQVAVNAHFLDCPFFKPCTWQSYDIVAAPLGAVCA